MGEHSGLEAAALGFRLCGATEGGFAVPGHQVIFGEEFGQAAAVISSGFIYALFHISDITDPLKEAMADLKTAAVDGFKFVLDASTLIATFCFASVIITALISLTAALCSSASA